jgi:O-antigen/teichoic acid export membrane protein
MRRLADVEQRRLLSTFAYLVGTQGATALLGLAYWPISTHFFPAAAVGVAATATSTANLLGSLGVLGVATLLVAEIRSIEPSSQRLAVSTGILVAGSIVLVLGIGTVLLSPVLGHSVRVMGSDPLVAVLFVVGAVGTVATTTFDNAAIGLRRSRTRLVRAVLASVLKLAIVGALVLAGVQAGAGLVSAWTAGLVLSLFVGWSLLRLERPHDRPGFAARVEIARRYRTLSLHHHVLNLSISSVSYVLPVVAALLVAPTAVAWFATAQVVSSVALLVPYLVAYALFAEAAADEALLHRLVRRTFPLSLVACALVIGVVEIAAPVALRFFGPAYAAHGTKILRLLVLGGFPYVVKDHYVAVRRAQRRLALASRVLALATVGETAAGIVGGVLWGLVGLSAGWSIAAAVEAIVLLPAVIAVYRRPSAETAEREESPI